MRKSFRNQLMLGSARMTATERRVGRFLRAPDGHESGEEGANTGGNTGTESQSGNGNTNTSGEDDLKSFWNPPSESESKPAAQAGSAKPNSESEGEPESLGAQLASQIEKSDFGQFMTDDTMKELADGKFDKFNQGINAAMRKSVQQGLEMNVQVLGKFGDALLARVESMMGNRETQKENADFLVNAIPSAKNPLVRPMVDTIYAQALKINGNDREKAIATTKRMMATMATETSGDLDLQVLRAGEGEDQTIPQSKSINWVSELMAKKPS